MILLTGGAGYIGSHTLVELLHLNHEVLVVDNFSNSSPKVLNHVEKITGKKVIFEEVDITILKDLVDVFKKYKISSVIHFAANKSVGESVDNPLLYYHNNISGLVNILKACQQFEVTNFVFSSSCTVYGSPEAVPVTEDSPVQPPASPYGNSKQIGEEMLLDFANSYKDFKYLNLRYFNPIGAHESGLLGDNPTGKPNNLLPYVTRVAAGELDELAVFGGDYNTKDGTGVRDFIHVVDLAKAHISALEKLSEGKVPNDVHSINIGTGIGYSVLELINTFEDVTGLKVNYKITDRRPGDVPEIYADPSKSKSILNWQANLNLKDMVSSAWNFQTSL